MNRVDVIDPVQPAYHPEPASAALRPGSLVRHLHQIPFDLGNFYGNDASSTYNAFEVKVEKRFTKACSS